MTGDASDLAERRQYTRPFLEHSPSWNDLQELLRLSVAYPYIPLEGLKRIQRGVYLGVAEGIDEFSSIQQRRECTTQRGTRQKIRGQTFSG